MATQAQIPGAAELDQAMDPTADAGQDAVGP